MLLFLPVVFSPFTQKMFFYFQADSSIPISYTQSPCKCRTLSYRRSFFTESMTLTVTLIFSSLLSFLTDHARLFYPLRDLLTWHSFVIALNPGTKDWRKLGCVGRERPGLLPKLPKQVWAVTLHLRYLDFISI